MPRREHARRTGTTALAKRTYTLAEMQRQVSGGTDRPCIATYLHDVEGKPAMVLMADSCPTCTDFKRQIPPPPPPMPLTPLTTTEEIDQL